MKYLLDTHVFLWAILDDRKLSSKAAAVILDTSNDLYFSAASYWEICIKAGLKKLKLKRNWAGAFDREIAVNGIKWLAIEKAHMRGVVTLPRHHGDPFDRLLISQCKVEKLTLITADSHMPTYGIKCLLV